MYSQNKDNKEIIFKIPLYSTKNSPQNLDDDKMQTNKNINIVGTHTRYEMKKLIEEDKKIKYKKLLIDENEINNQKKELIYILNNNLMNYSHSPIMNAIYKKWNGYKQQDIKKNIYDKDKIITVEQIVNKIINSNFKCEYCFCNVFILYNIIREIKQWSLERIDNSVGHSDNNTIIACLECNLQRKNRNKDKFLLSKNIIIKRDNYPIQIINNDISRESSPESI